MNVDDLEFKADKKIKEKTRYVRDEDGLLPKQRLFVEHLIRGKNQRQAALAAGYSQEICDKHVSNLLKKREVLEYYHKRRSQAAIALSIDSDAFLKMLLDEIRDPATSKRDKAEFMKMLQKAIGAEKNNALVQINNPQEEQQNRAITINIVEAQKPDA
jgi:phage terminase small subunit